jgi:cytochrome c oxidase subunit 2
MQEVVLLVSLLAIAAVVAAFGRVLRELAPSEPMAPEAVTRLRSRILWGSGVVGVAIALATLLPWPHAVPAGPAVVPVRVRASMWAWELDRTSVPVGVPVVFHVTSTDVNHGFGVFDASGRLLFQTQAMPGWVNKVAWTFTEPGRYRVLCLEYCGLVHHGMMAELEVDAAGRGEERG